MGLDGISINQLRIINEPSVIDYNAKLNPANDSRVVDKLSDGQRVDPDKEKEHEEFLSGENSEESTEQEAGEDVSEDNAEMVNFDLSNGDRYALEICDDNSVMVVDKTINSVVQKIDASRLSSLVNYLSSSQGCFVNRKF